jgi:hypothetical protein
MTNGVSTNPGHGRAGRHPKREYLDSLSGHDDPGMFGRMFPTLAPLTASDAALQALADAMKDASPGDQAGNNPNIPAGFTYLGQFVDHDITLDLTSLSEKQKDPLGIENFRTPSLDLDSVYGLGPDGSPQLYARNPAKGNSPGPKLLVGTTVQGFGNAGNVPPGLRNDLPRSPEGVALIGDHRNDENLVVAQTHLAFVKFHNKVVDVLAGGANPPADLFFEARRLVTWHYQWLVLHDFVERVTEQGIVAKILHEGRKFYRFKKFPYMPVEFSAAAYRLGHSMVREVYGHNRVFTPGGEAVPATLKLLFDFSGLSGGIIGDLAPNPPTAPTPIRLLPSNWVIDWRRFYDFKTPAQPGFFLNSARKLDPFLVPQLHTLPGGGGNLAFRNLRRGVMLGLPSGQDVAAAMKVPNPLKPEEIATGPDGAAAKAHGLHQDTPLWYYILKEAQMRSNGERLGPVGARLVAEVFVGLVHGDQTSYLWLEGKDWKPTLPSKVPGTFTMTDLLQFVGDISPIDGITTVNTL